MEEQKINKKITIGVVAVLLIVLITIGATYAYFSAQAETGTQTVTTGTLTMNFDKEGSAVTIDGITPINDSEIKTKAAAFPFSITNTGTAHMNITIKLKDIAIADDLKDIDFRWGLYNADTNKGISFGIFKHAETGGEEIIYRDSIIESGAPTKNYILRIWIHDDGDNQNYMQGETFSAKIDVTGKAVEYTPESCFTFNENTGAITAYNRGTEDFMTGNIEYDYTCPTDIVVPKTIGGKTVTTLSSLGPTPTNVVGVTSIILPDTVTTISNYAFNNRGKINHITIPESVTSLGDYSVGFSSAFIPENSYLSVAGDAFGYSSADLLIVPGTITNLKLPLVDSNDIILMDGVTKISSGHFFFIGVKSIELPSTVTTVEKNAFYFDPSMYPDDPAGAMFLKEIIVRGKSSLSDFADSTGLTTAGGLPEGVNIVFRP